MSFFAFKMLFIVLALGFLVVAVLVGRQLWRKRQPQSPEPRPKPPREPLAEAPKRKLPGLGRKVVEPEPTAAPPIARRRQLQSFAEAERLAAEAEGEPVLPTLPVAAEAEPAAEPAWLAEPEPAPEPEPVAEITPAADADAADFGEAVLARLEEAFEALQAGGITLGGYRERLLDEQAAVQERIAALQAGEDHEELGAALATEEAVQWCLDWADEQEGLPQR